MRATFDSVLAIILVTLAAPQLTAIPAHEIAGASLVALLLVHLLLHRNLFASRRSVHAALNIALFAVMVVALVSGFAISKWLLPVSHTPGRYLTWREIHDTSSRVAVAIAGLHVGMNWRRLWSRLPLRPIMNRVVPVGLLTAVAVVATIAVGALLPPVGRVTLIAPGGKREFVPPPATIARLRPEQHVPNVARGAGPFAAMSVLFAASAGISAAIVRSR